MTHGVTPRGRHIATQGTGMFGAHRRAVGRLGSVRRRLMFGLMAVGVTAMAGCSREAAPSATTVDPMVQWCDVADELTTLADTGEAPGTTGTASDAGGSERATLEQLVALLDKAKSVAPPEISADVVTAADSAHEISNLLDSVDYDDSKISDEMLARYQDLGEELAQASAVITDFNQRYCGVGTADPRRDQTIADLVLSGLTEKEASCLYDAVDTSINASGVNGSSGADGSDSAFASGQELFASCGIDPARADEIAAVLASEVSQ